MTKNLKKYDVFVYILAILLLIFIASFFPSTEVTHSPETTLAAPTNSDNWQDSASYRDTSWSGSGTSGSPYLITSAQELAGLAYMVNSGTNYSGTYFRQTQDIDLSAHYWTPIGNPSRYFGGNYDGYFCQISNIYVLQESMVAGLFGRSSGSLIENIKIINGLISHDDNFSGLVGGICATGQNSTFKNCLVDCNIENTGGGSVGGIIAVAENSVIINCCFLGNISPQHAYNSLNCGGIVANATDSEISNCYNSGNIDVNCSSGNIGGIIGRSSDNSMTNCFNYGSISVRRSGSTSYLDACIGGVVGRRDHYIYNCFNIASITYDTGDTNHVGAVTGRDTTNVSSTYNCYYGGECTLNYGTGKLYSDSSSGSNNGYTRITNINSASYAKRQGWYTTTSNWNSTYPWDFTNTWAINSSINDGYPFIREFYEYSISYNYNGGSAGSSSPSVGFVGATITISNPTPASGYRFTGWTASGLNTSTAQYGNSSSSLTSWTNGSTRVTGTYFRNLAAVGQTVTLTANYEMEAYSIQLNFNNGAASQYINDVSMDTAVYIANPAQAGYNFTGWSSTNISSTARVGSSPTDCNTPWTSGQLTTAQFFKSLTSVGGRTVILTANWEPKQYTITFDLDGGTGSTSMTYTINGNYTLPEPNKTGHTFTGWQFVSQSGEGNWSSGTYSAGTSLNGKYGNISLRATWRANTYTVTFDPQGGSVSPTTIQVTYGQPYGYHNNGVLPTPSRLDYNFETWATARFASGDYDSIFATDIYMIDGDSTLYAKWSTTWNIYAEKPEGNGTTASPYLISKPEHLGWLSYQVARGGQTTAVCKQTANINISQLVVGRVSPQWYPIGTLTYPFRGSYDGNGFNIWSGKYINVYTTNWGIFGCTNGAKLNRVYVTSSGDIDEDVVDFDLSIFQNTNIGGIIGYAWGSTTLTNCALSGRVATTINMTNKGALIGNATSSVTISDCVVFPLTTHDNSSLGISGGSPRIESCVYVINGAKGYTFTGYSDTTETNYVIVDYLSVPVPAGLSWLAYGGERATLAEIKSWANS